VNTLAHPLIESLGTYPLAGAIAILFFALSIGHVLADYPLQGSYLARTKIPSSSSNNDSSEGKHLWGFSLYAHCLIHAGLVWVITGNVWFALVELVAHAIIDLLKIKEKTGYACDQILHYACKLVYAIIIVYTLS